MSVIIGVATGVLASLLVIVLVQVLPSLYGWGTEIGWAQEEKSGRNAYHVRFGLAPPRTRFGRAVRRWRKRARKRHLVPRRYGPFDVLIHARVAVRGLSSGDLEIETVVAIPVDKEWRPAIAQGVLTWLRPEFCNELELRSFPKSIQEKRGAQQLTMHDLLAVPEARLRLYAYGSRPYIGTRLVARGSFRLGDIVPGLHKEGVIVRSADGMPPTIPASDLPPQFVGLPEPSQKAPGSGQKPQIG